MAARDKERYYWLKLKRDFFKRHDIRVIEDMPNGKEYVLFYLKLMVEAIDHEGALRFSDTIPYSESMLSSVTNTNVDIVRSALRLFMELGMVELLNDETLYLSEVARLLDSETYAAGRQRELREKKTGGDIVACLSPGCRQDTEKESDTERDKETEIESEIEKEKKKESESTEPEGSVCRTKDVRRIVQAWNSLGLQQITKLTPDSKRGCMLRARVREYGTEAVLQAIEKIRSSAFLRGQNTKGWVITFEWFVRPNNFPKVLEGNYDEARGPAGAETSNPFLAMLMEEEHDCH